MQNNKMKNTIVIRGMASNVVEEAIVILKPHVKLKKMEHTRNFREKDPKKEVILREAEHVVAEYVDRINQDSLSNQKKILESKVKKLKVLSILFFVLFIISIII